MTRLLTLAAATALAGAATSTGTTNVAGAAERNVSGTAERGEELRLATWNMEWLIAPDTFRALEANCAPDGTAVGGNTRRLPCDVVARHERDSADFRTLADYAKRLDADVIALQEVDGADAAREVFPGYRFCFTGRRHVQNTGFAIRKGIAHRCGRDVRDLSLGDSVRRGAELILYPGEPREIRLLSIHLKAGCQTGLLDSRRKQCQRLARQVEPLEAWIDAQAAAGRPFAVLGDFNRNLLGERGAARAPSGRQQLVWPEIDDADPPEADLVNTAAGERFVNCAVGHAYRNYIDYIVLSRTLGERMVPGSFRRVTYDVRDSRRRQLSDHCPVGVTVRMEAR